GARRGGITAICRYRRRGDLRLFLRLVYDVVGDRADEQVPGRRVRGAGLRHGVVLWYQRCRAHLWRNPVGRIAARSESCGVYGGTLTVDAYPQGGDADVDRAWRGG